VFAAENARNQGAGRDPQLRTLLIRPGGIGDLIISLPALEHLTSEYTEVWVATQNVPLIRFTSHIRSIASTGLDLLELGSDSRVLELLRGFDRIVSWYGSSRESFRDAVSALPFTFHTALPDGTCHAVDFYMRQAGGQDGAVPRIDVGFVAKRDFIAIHPFSGSRAKNWPLERFRAMAATLPYPAEFCAGPEEPLEDAVRCDDLWELACWLASARGYVGNDSGITHLAAAVGLPVTAIFRTTDPAVWAPRGDVTVLLQP
jgi:ADP-heptose:LPS heptosyltransferase